MNRRHARPEVGPVGTSGRVDPANRVNHRADDGRNETPNERSDRNWNDILQELRVALTGTQLIGGFLLAVAFQPRFEELDAYQLTLYLVLVALAGLATVIGLAPVTLHRTLFRRQAKERVVRTGNRLLIADLAVVALLVIGVTSLVFDFALSRIAGFVALGIGAVILAALWLVLPRLQAAEVGDDADVVDAAAGVRNAGDAAAGD
ncbi:DUF6328 family protein [Agromyces albus]|uniref:DUF6328 family protein n=1 Tax=Agromyces albus TaxID=205332 RepID=UPI00278683F6|nr:DUF6328 family protein [Agromyces albus]MDQ0577011.1 protein-S-isoprenylcysteine O-methyltransferase Ste14 [Agromyces albus]